MEFNFDDFNEDSLELDNVFSSVENLLKTFENYQNEDF